MTSDFVLGQAKIRNPLEILGSSLILCSLFFINMPLIKLPAVFLTLSDILMIFGLISFLISNQIINRGILGKYTIYWYLGTLLIIIGLILSSIIRGADLLESIIVSSQYAFSLLIIPLALSILPQTYINKVIHIYILGLIVVCLFGIILYFFIPDLAKNYMIGGRMGSLLGNPNSLSKTIAVSLPILVYLQIRRIIRPWVFYSAIGLFITTLMIASSFGGILASILAFIATIILFNKGTLWRQIIVATILIGIFANNFVTVPAIFEKRIYSVIETGNFQDAGSSEDKIQLMNSAVKEIYASPFIGSGADTFSEKSDLNQSVHNTYLLLWTEGGLLSFIGFIVLLLAPLLSAIYIYNNPTMRLLGVTLLISSVIFILNAATNPHLYGRFWFTPLIIILFQLGRAHVVNNSNE